ncbi:MAG TPA: outer membrane protein transport protein [Acidobacteriaceae bacterium]|nr:outer membrane protein transport protein [Acidobacteriaceae bacterium]
MFIKVLSNNRKIQVFLFPVAIVCGLFWVAAANTFAQSAGAFGNGLSAAAVGRGGTMVAAQGEPLEAMQGNPAGLAGIRTRVLDVSGVGMLASGSFQNSVDQTGQLSGNAGALPYGAFGISLGSSHWKGAVAITPEMLMRADWRYVDPPGTAGASYGLQKNESQILAMRSSVGLAWTVNSKWAVGSSVGLVYNTNTLNAPYIFQQQPQLAGLKVLLDLHTRGFGWDGSAGVQWQPLSRVRLGVAWKSATFVQSHGDASGSASAQFAALGIVADPIFHYQAEVDNHLPQAVAAGLSWQASHRMQWTFEGDWVDWSGAFQQLPVKLTMGTNATINSVVGASALRDDVPLHWRDQGVFRMGAEMPVAPGWTARAGYVYMSNPVPSATLTPLTAAILRNSLAAGGGWNRGHLHWDLAYQVQLPASQNVEQSTLLAGEYDHTHVRVMTQSLTITARVNF